MSPSVQKGCCSVHASIPWAIAPACPLRSARSEALAPATPPPWPRPQLAIRWRKGRETLHWLKAEIGKSAGFL